MAGVRPRPGDYRRWVTLSILPDTLPGNNGQFVDLVPSGSWASIQPVGGSVSDRSTEHVVEMRYRPDVTIDCKLTYNGRDLFVRSVQNLNEEDIVLRLTCEEIAS